MSNRITRLSTGQIIPWVYVFWDVGVTTDVNCIARHFTSVTVHVPGVDPDAANTVQTDTVVFKILPWQSMMAQMMITGP